MYPDRLPQPEPTALEHSARLSQLVRTRIEEARGWISFTSYMELTLYAPGLGYYSGGASKFGTAGDFITAPELSPLFARTLARQLAQVLRVTGGDVLELGAGSGRLAHDLLLALDQLHALPERYCILDTSAELAQRQRQRIELLPERLRGKVQWLVELPAKVRGVILANEVLDAVPVHMLVWSEGGVSQRGVGWRERGFVFEDRPLAAGALLDAAHRLRPDPPYVSEISLAAYGLVRTLAALLEQGVMLLIDYGFGESEYYHPQRSSGTLMCHYRHRAHDDPFFLPGLQDITAHVDFSAVARAAKVSGCELLGYVTQARFLINLGITELLEGEVEPSPAGYLAQAAPVQKLLSPAEMGELFKVIALGRGVEFELSGFREGDLSRLL